MNPGSILTNEAEARAFVAGLGPPAATARLEAFARLVIEENAQQNLIAKASEAELWRRHIADSAQLLGHVPRETWPGVQAGPWLDLGSGPGFPGLVIAALRPELPVVLVESRRRRAEFLLRCVERLDLPQCRVEGCALERVQPFPARVISARAFAPLSKLLALSAPFSTSATFYVLPKGRSAAQELAGIDSGLRAGFHVEHSLTDPEAGIIVGHASPDPWKRSPARRLER